MISREDLSTINRNRAESIQPVKYCSPSAVRSAELAKEVDAFLSSGGKIESVPFGKSAHSYDVSLPLRQIKEMEIARQKYNDKRSILKRIGKAELTKNTYIGDVCPIDGNQVRFLSNAQCKICAQRKYLKNIKRRSADAEAN